MAAEAPLAAELAERPTDALREEQQALRRQLAAIEGRQRTRDRLAEQRVTAERLLENAEERAATSGLPGDDPATAGGDRRRA